MGCGVPGCSGGQLAALPLLTLLAVPPVEPAQHEPSCKLPHAHVHCTFAVLAYATVRGQFNCVAG
jgi:hypothetical protein